LIVLWLIPAICTVLGASCALAGVIAFARAWRRLQGHAERVVAAPPLALLDSARLETALARIDRDLDAAKSVLGRVATAWQEIRARIGDLRLREAVVALRVALVAIRALRALY
jgi:hypothetical protein